VGAQRPRSRPDEPRPSGQHLLRSGPLARELVAQAGVGSADLVLELGAGTGRITEALAGPAARVIAVELDPGYAEILRRRFRTERRVTIVEADVLQAPLPGGPFRAFGNIPFGLTTAILRRLLDDPASPLVRADLVVEYDVARKRSSAWPSNLVSLGWLPWWDFRLSRHLPASAFEPPPFVDAGLLSIAKRPRPLIPSDRRGDFMKLLRLGFRQASLPVDRSLRGRVPERAWKRTARERGIGRGATPSDLDVFDWVALFLLVPHFTRP
jgi:23S rRNA (adenine-N6)-dimethyltransferase